MHECVHSDSQYFFIGFRLDFLIDNAFDQQQDIFGTCDAYINKKPTKWWGQAKRRATQLYNLGRHSVKFTVSLRVILFQTMTELCASMPVTSILRTFMQYLIAFCSRPEAAADVISGRFVRLTVPNKFVKFCDPCLNRSPDILPKTVGCGIFNRFFKHP